MHNDNMNRTIKLIWDFKGEDAQQTADHHIIHLEEFGTKENLSINKVGVETINDNHFIAFMHVIESEVFSVRDALIPHRAELVE